MAWIEDDHSRKENGEFTYKNKAPLSEDGDYDKNMSRLVDIYSSTPAEDKAAMGINNKKDGEESEIQRKISSVHIDFTKDNVLPELNEDTIQKMGLEKNRPVLFKSETIIRNLSKHFDVEKDVYDDIISEVLYNPIDVFQASSTNPNYFHLASFVQVKDKDGLKMGLVLLDADTSKEYIEIVHAYFVSSKGYDWAKNRA